MRPGEGEDVVYFDDVVAEMERSEINHFVKVLTKSTIPDPNHLQGNTELLIPASFVRANEHNLEQWVIFRLHSPRAASSRPWVVRLCVTSVFPDATKVRFINGWRKFVTRNDLREGDTLIFVLRDDRRSEFEVRVFRGPQRIAHYPD